MSLQITVALLKITAKRYYKLRQLYYKLRQCVITDYSSFIKFLQITAAFGIITNYGNTLLQITAGIAIYDVITNYVVTATEAIFSFFVRPYHVKDGLDTLITT